MARTMWAARLSEAPPGQIEFALYPWVVSNEKLKQTTGCASRRPQPQNCLRARCAAVRTASFKSPSPDEAPPDED